MVKGGDVRDLGEMECDLVEEEVGVTCFVVDANEAMCFSLSVALPVTEIPQDGVRPDWSKVVKSCTSLSLHLQIRLSQILPYTLMCPLFDL